MIYIYDIVLNFQQNYYCFFEWNPCDEIINIKRIPVFRVSDKDFLSFKYHHLQVDNHFIELIKDKTKFYSKNDHHLLFLISNLQEAMGIKINNNGLVIGRSSLILEEESEVIDECQNLPLTEFKFLKNITNPVIHQSRIESEKKRLLKNNLQKIKDYHLLKYLYYEYFNQEEADINIIKDKLFNQLSKEWTDNHERVYQFFLTYKKS